MNSDQPKLLLVSTSLGVYALHTKEENCCAEKKYQQPGSYMGDTVWLVVISIPTEPLGKEEGVIE